MKKLVLILAALALSVLACTPSAEVIERDAVDRISGALDLGDLKCEEARPHPNQENVWILYCDRAGSNWALVDAAASYNGPKATATATAMFQTGSFVVTYKQTCEWVSRNNNWTVSSCTTPIRTSSFPLG